MKNSCHQAVISGKKVIGNAHELYSYCKEQLSVNQVASEREFIFRDSSDVERERPNADDALLVGTRKIHSVLLHIFICLYLSSPVSDLQS